MTYHPPDRYTENRSGGFLFAGRAICEREPLYPEEVNVNKGQLIGGVICLIIAAMLAVLNIVLPPDKIMFQIGDENMPWIPVAGLGVVGIVLLVAAANSAQAPAKEAQPAVPQNPEKTALNKRLESIGWGLFFIMLGGAMLVPHNTVNEGWWSIGVGLIMLGLNVARYFNQIKMSGFTTFLGVVSIISGVLQLLGQNDLGGAIFLIVLGSYLLVRPWFDRRQLFGKAEESQ